jgi:hypothetical protein
MYNLVFSFCVGWAFATLVFSGVTTPLDVVIGVTLLALYLLGMLVPSSREI